MLKTNQLPSMASRRSYHLIKLLMLIGASIEQRISLQDIIGLQCNSPYG